MARHHNGLPRPHKFILSKAHLLDVMATIDSCTETSFIILLYDRSSYQRYFTAYMG